MKNHFRLLIAALILLSFPKADFAQAPILGTAANFVLFSTDGAVTNSGISQLTGNVGTNNGSNTGFGNVNGTMNSANGASAQASADLLVAYNQLNGATTTAFRSASLGNGDTLSAGVYEIGSAAVMGGVLTLNANGNSAAVFIIKVQGSLSANANSKVRLINGAKACNVFWKIEGLVSLATGITMKGTIIANNAAINMNTGDTLEGRALSTNGAVIVNGMVAYTPIGCGSPTLTGPAAPVPDSTASYALFTGNGQVSNTGTTHVNGGDIGTNNGTVTGFDSTLVTGKIHKNPDASTLRCDTDLVHLYNYINSITPDIELLYPSQLGNNLVLTPHTYLLDAATVLTDTLYLNAQGNASAVFVMKIHGALTTSVGSRIVLMNGTQSQNVFWAIDGAANINNLSIFQGTMLVTNGTLSTGSLLNGRMLSSLGALNTANATINTPGATAPLTDLIISTTTGVEGMFNNVTVTGTGNGTLTGNLVVMGNMIIQTGGRLNTANNLVQGTKNFTMNSGSVLTVHSPAGISATGDYGDIQVAGVRTFSPGATYIYAGNSPQVTGNGLPAAADSLVITNTNGVSLSASQTVNRRLLLGNGNLNLNAYNLTIAPGGGLANASAAGYVATDDTAGSRGSLKMTVTSAGAAMVFAVGSASLKGSYTPATVTMSSGTTDVVSVRVFTGVMSAGLTGPPVSAHVVKRSWVISEAVAGGSVASVLLQWRDTMEAAPFTRARTGIAYYKDGSWHAPSAASYVAAAGSNPYTVSRSGISAFGVFIVADSTTNSTLPVMLLSFSGTRTQNDVILNWKTATEINNSRFEIERSADGITFENIGSTRGAGNSTMPVSYSFEDRSITAKSGSVLYYRLKQVDFDGSVKLYSPIAISREEAADGFAITTFPNPVTQNVQLNISSVSAGQATIAIYNMQGKAVATRDLLIAEGSSVVSIDLEHLPGGLYFVTTVLNGKAFRQTLVKTVN